MKTPYLTTADAADELGMTIRQVQRLCCVAHEEHEGKIVLLIGRDWLIPRGNLNALKALQRPVGRPPQPDTKRRRR